MNEAENQINIKGIQAPSAVEVEAIVLGAMMIDNEAMLKGIQMLGVDVFYVKKNGIIFQAMQNLFKSNEAVDNITVFAELNRMGKGDSAGGPAYLAELTTNIASAANFEYYARIIIEKSILRDVIGVGTEVTETAYKAREDALSILQHAEKKIFEITEKHIRKSYISLKEAVNDTMDFIDRLHSGDKNTLSSVPSDYYDLDDKLGGFHKSDLIILAARPSMGKTAFALNIARNAANYVPTAVFSLEMSNQQLVTRLLCSEARLNAHQVRTGKLPQQDMQYLGRSASKLVELPMFIDDMPAQTILEISAKARRLKAEKGIGFIVIDYLQLMQGPDKAESREREISHISRSLKALAKEIDIPILVLAQLNREVEKRNDRMPQLSDLRESGSIEQDADVVLFIHRPEYYGITSDPKDGSSTEGMAEIIIAKHRNGPTGEVKLRFVKDYAKFENADNYRQALPGGEEYPSLPSVEDPF
jgi:replicative DNA helicase